MIIEGKIAGVKIKQLRPIPDERGRLMEILRADDPIFSKFGQVYLTTAYPGVVKAWHYHKSHFDNLTVITGMMKIGLYDSRHDSPTFGQVDVVYAGEQNPVLVHVPPFIFHGFKCISEHEALVVNIASEVYNPKQPDEFRLDPHSPEVPFDWARKDG